MSNRGEDSPRPDQPDGLDPTRASPALAPSPFPHFPGFSIVAELRGGAQGDVFKAVQLSTGRLVALKVLRPGAGEESSDVARFEIEKRTLISLRHPNIVTLFEAGMHAGRRYFAMEYVDGSDLDKYVQTTSPTWRELLQLFLTICRAVGHAHAAGVVHRDLKPGNILIDRLGTPRIVDFGLAKNPAGENLTQTDVFMGTLAFAAPEQAAGATSYATSQTDVYSLGVILYRLLTGQFPYRVDSAPEIVLRNIREAVPRPPSRLNPQVPRDLDTIVLRAMAKEPRRRYANASEMADDLARFLAGEPIHAARDSVLYLATSRLRSAVRHRPIVSFFFEFATAVVAFWLVSAVAQDAYPLRLWFERTGRAFPPVDVAALQDVRVLLIDDEPMAELGPELGVTETVPFGAGRPYYFATQPLAAALGTPDPLQPSARRLFYAALHRRALEARPRVITWDICLVSRQPTDEVLRQALRDGGERGIPAVLAWPDWWFRGSQPNFADVAHIGCVTYTDESELAIDLALQRDEWAALPSIGLAAYAAARFPHLEPRYLIQPPDCVQIAYFRRGEAARFSWPVERIPPIRVTRSQPVSKPDRTGELWAGDTVALQAVALPPQQVFDDATIPLAEFCRMSMPELRDRIQDRFLVIGTGADDMHSYRGRSFAGAYVHALALDSLVRQAPVRHLNHWVADAILLPLMGLVLISGRARRWLLLASAVTASAVLVIAIGLLTYRFAGIFFQPLEALIAIASAGFVAWVSRAILRRPVFGD